MVLTMNPYREKREEKASKQESPERDDEVVLMSVWFFLGSLLLISDILEPGPWGVAFSLGMLVLVGAIAALLRHRKHQRQSR
jgi:hypothetical protein